MDELVSVVIPNYNGSQFIQQCIESVLSQDYKNLEIIVVDDGSEDSSLEAIKKFSDKVKIITLFNSGSSAARNAGVLASTGELIAFLDSDDYWMPTKITKQVAEMQSSSYDLIYCHGQEFGSNEEGLIHRAKFEGNCYEQYRSSPARSIVELGCSTAMIRKSVLTKSGLFDSDFKGPAEDWDFFRRYCKEARIGYCDEILVMYRRHSHNLSSISLDNYFKGNKRAIIKLFTADTEIGFFERRKIWLNFCILFAKSYLKQKRFDKVFKIIILAFSPILL